MMPDLLGILYFITAMYSLHCAPGVFSRLFPYRYSEEYEYLWLLGSIVLGLTLLAAILRPYFIWKDK